MSESINLPSTNKGNERSFVANPRAPKGEPIAEPTGPAAADSLAAESVRDEGKFAENENPNVLSVSGSKSTLNNTDTSGAERLDPARSGAERDGDRFSGEEYSTTGASKYTTGAPRSTTTNTQTGTATGTGTGTGTSTTGGTTTITSSSNTTSTGAAGVRPYVESAPNAFGDHRTEADLKPKGQGLEEGRDIPPNRSTFTGDVGGPKDPGRVAERTFEGYNAQSGVGAGQPRDMGDGSGDAGVGYENLNSSERA